MLDPIFEFLDGKEYVLAGVSGVFRHRVSRALYPYEHTVEQLFHEPDAAGRQTETYQRIKRELGDDHDTDMTNSERVVEIAIELGYDGLLGYDGEAADIQYDLAVELARPILGDEYIETMRANLRALGAATPTNCREEYCPVLRRWRVKYDLEEV